MTGDSPSATLNDAGTVIESTLGLPGDALVTLRSSGNIWSYPNVSGHIAATADQTGTKTGNTTIYDPYGVALDSNAFVWTAPIPIPAPTTPPDNNTGEFDYGWHGQYQRPLEHQTGLIPIIEMGARQYLPRQLGRFLETDPIEGGSQ